MSALATPNHVAAPRGPQLVTPTCYTEQDLATQGWNRTEEEIRAEVRPHIVCPVCQRLVTNFVVYTRGIELAVYCYSDCGLFAQEV